MPLIATERAVASSRRQLGVLLVQGTLGLVLLSVLTFLRAEEVPRILAEIGPSAPVLVTLLALFATTLSCLKFRLTREIFVSPAVIAYMAIFPLLGSVLSAWIAVLVAALARFLAMAGIGSTAIDVADPVQYARTYGLFGTYGLPMIAASLVYELLGGTVPLRDATVAAAAQIFAGFLVFMVVNILVMSRLQGVLGYSVRTRARLTLVDAAVYLLALPYSVLITFCWGGLGYLGLVLALFTGVVGTVMVGNLAAARSANLDLVRRLSSLANIGAAISIESTQERLLATIYEECRKAIDVAMFTIALLDEEREELFFAFEICDGELRSQARVPLGDGLNSWVVRHREPLLLHSVAEERRLGLQSLEDDVPSESWLGVPMVVKDRVVGVISVQSLRKNAFSDEDVVLLQAVASQAAVAIEDARLYQALEHAADELEHRVMERTRDLREINLQLAAADQAKTRFLATMSHELRTPLNSIIGFSRILFDRTHRIVSPRMHGFLQNILDSGTHLLALINELLDLSKIDAGRLSLSIEPFDLHEAVARVERITRGIAADEGVSIETRVDPGLSQVWMDEGRIRQILFNLLSNAVKFSPPRGVVRLEIARVEGTESPLGCDTVRVSVEDQGVGIPKAELPKIFEEFYQVVGDPRARRGTGLGLPLSLRLVELHHGTIDVWSQPGRGATFIVDLPVRADRATPREPLGETLLDAGSRPT